MVSLITKSTLVCHQTGNSSNGIFKSEQSYSSVQKENLYEQMLVR
jgi:hypothetical protein